MKRWIFKIAVFAGLMALLHVGVLHPVARECVRAADPLLFLANCLTGTVLFFDAGALLIGLTILVLCVRKRRFFCHWLCPLGFLQDLLRVVSSALSRRLNWNLPAWLLHKPGMVLAFVSFLGLFFGGFTFLFLDPLVILDGAHHTRWACWLATGIGVLVLVAPWFWCVCICPCGGTQELLWRVVRLFQQKSSSNETDSGKKRKVSRRLFLLSIGIGVWGILKYATLKTVQTIYSRPPGAVPEPDFLARCTRCGACAGVCPTHLIVLNDDLRNPSVFGTPKLDFHAEKPEERVFCDENCVKCTEICPTGALKKIPLTEKKNIRLGKCEFQYELCRRYYQMECSICLQVCPYEALEEVWSEESYSKVPSVNPDLCVGCGKCVAFCPGEPLVEWNAEAGGYVNHTDETTGKKALKIGERNTD